MKLGSKAIKTRSNSGPRQDVQIDIKHEIRPMAGTDIDYNFGNKTSSATSAPKVVEVVEVEENDKE